jgi:dTDP-4-amino-4,6-dideoxygalactose transaminase
VLAVEPGFAGAEATATLPAAEHPAALKLAARALWATENPEVERQGVALNTESEESWPDRPCRMSDLSQALLPRLDVAWHRETRRRNRDRLAARLDGKIPFWSDRTGTPFSLPIFAGNRPDLLKALHAARVFASPLWPDAPCDSAQHPLAAWFAANLVSLPIDQRHRDEDIDRIAAAVLQAAEPAKAVPSGADRFVTRP